MYELIERGLLAQVSTPAQSLLRYAALECRLLVEQNCVFLNGICVLLCSQQLHTSLALLPFPCRTGSARSTAASASMWRSASSGLPWCSQPQWWQLQFLVSSPASLSPNRPLWTALAVPSHQCLRPHLKRLPIADDLPAGFGSFISLIGSGACATLSFTVPALCHMLIFRSEGGW